MNEITADEKDINYQIFWNYLRYQNPLFLEKYLIRVKQYQKLAISTYY